LSQRCRNPTLVIVGLVGAILSADAPTVLSALLAVQRINRSGTSEPLFNVDTDLILADGVWAEIIFVHSDLLRCRRHLAPGLILLPRKMIMPLGKSEMSPVACTVVGRETANAASSRDA
jgi:hypothetical protein